MKIEIEVALTVTLWASFDKPDPYYKFPEAYLAAVPLTGNRLCISFTSTPNGVSQRIEEVTKLIELRGGEIE